MAIDVELFGNQNATGNPELQSSVQGANRTQVINEISKLSDDPFRALSQQAAATKEFGGSRSPVDLIQTGGVEVNSASAAVPSVPSEVGKGSIADTFV